MNNNLDNLLLTLDDEIERKCFEIKQKKTEKALKFAFILGCTLFTIVPFILVFMGINLFAMLIPVVIFFAVSFVALMPLIFNNFGGITQ